MQSCDDNYRHSKFNNPNKLLYKLRHEYEYIPLRIFKLYCWTSRFYTFLCCLLCKINNYIVLKINRSAVKKTFEIFINNRVDAHGWLDFYIRIFLILSIALSCNCFKFEIKATKWNSGVNSKLFWTKDSGKWNRDRIDVKIYIENFTFKSFLENCVQNILISKVSS